MSTVADILSCHVAWVYHTIFFLKKNRQTNWTKWVSYHPISRTNPCCRKLQFQKQNFMSIEQSMLVTQAMKESGMLSELAKLINHPKTAFKDCCTTIFQEPKHTWRVGANLIFRYFTLSTQSIALSFIDSGASLRVFTSSAYFCLP